MLKHQLEGWALDVLDRVAGGGRVEDSRVEAKREWPDAIEAARQIAAHANAARGAPILWLIGADEKGHTVPGADYNELANWFPRVQSQFDDLAPALQDLNVPYHGVSVAALHFETDRAPFVVKNPAGGRISLEVPWREGTKTRTAGRTDLLRLLSAPASLPDVETLSAELRASQGEAPNLVEWLLSVALYISPEANQRVAIPYHRCRAQVEFENPHLAIQFANLRLGREEKFNPSRAFVFGATSFVPAQAPGPPEYVSSEAVVDHPSRYILFAESITVDTPAPEGNALANIVLRPTAAETGVPVVVKLEPTTDPKLLGCWVFVGEGINVG